MVQAYLDARGSSMGELRRLFELLGLPPLLIVLGTLVTATAVYFLKQYFELRKSHRTKRNEGLIEYSRLQEEALFKAYRMLYEESDLSTVTQTEFRRLIKDADDMIMTPFTRYRAHLDKSVINRVYDIHNIVAQYRSNLSSDAINNLINYRPQFLD